MNVFDYIEKELDRIEVGYTSYDGTKITLTMDEVRELVQNLKKKYKADGDVVYRSDAIDEIENYPHGCTWNVESMKDMTDRIKALPSAEPEKMQLSREDATSDCISRKAALRLFATHDGKYLYEAIRQLPSTQPESKWISVNDKLPEEGSPVLLLYINEEIGFSESCRPKTWNQLTDNTIVGWFPIPKETKING